MPIESGAHFVPTMNKFVIRNIFTGSFPEPYLLAVSKTKIAVVDLTSNYSTFVFNGQNIDHLVIDPVDDKMYFKSEKGIFRANIDGYDKEVIYQNNRIPIRVFAFNWIWRRMYFVNSMDTKLIYVGSINFTNETPLHSSEGKISSLAVDPNVG